MTMPVLIAGPTASGKSALALAVAEKFGGVVINADSMQVYRDLRIITARPSLEDEAHAPHRLYGHVDAAENYSAGRWLVDARAALEEARAGGRTRARTRRHRVDPLQGPGPGRAPDQDTERACPAPLHRPGLPADDDRDDAGSGCRRDERP